METAPPHPDRTRIIMVSERGGVPGEAAGVVEQDDPTRVHSRPPAVGTVLLLAVWVGLVAGFLDLGFVVLKKHVSGDFYRLGDGFPWIIPTGVACVVGLPGLALAVIAFLRGGGVPFGVVVGLPAFVGFLDLCAYLPLA